MSLADSALVSSLRDALVSVVGFMLVGMPGTVPARWGRFDPVFACKIVPIGVRSFVERCETLPHKRMQRKMSPETLSKRS